MQALSIHKTDKSNLAKVDSSLKLLKFKVEESLAVKLTFAVLLKLKQ